MGAKYTSAMYAEMHPAEKEAWAARAEADKQRYMLELGTYLPPPGYDAKGDSLNMQGKVGRGKRKPERDVNAPKANISAYLLYQNAMRDQFKRENPGLTFGQLAKYTSHMYKNLTPEERAIWNENAAQDKIRYQNEIAQYVPPPGHDAKGNLVSEYRPTGKRHRKTQKDPNAPKRWRSSFVFFTFEFRPRVMQENPGIRFVDMGNVLGEMWRSLNPEEKKRYEDQAAQDKLRFAHEMEVYRRDQAIQNQVIQNQALQNPNLLKT